MQFVNNLRSLAILMIVFTHAISTVPTPGDFIWLVEFLVGRGTLLFIALAGYLFSATADGFRYGPFLKNKFVTVLLPYVFLSIPAIALYVSGAKSTHPWIDMDWFHGQLNVFQQIGYLLATGAHLGPLWFIPMVALYYLAAPAFVALRNSRFLAPVFFATLVVAFYVGRPDDDNNVLQSFAYFLPAYIGGIILERMPVIYRSLGKYSAALLTGYIPLLIAAYFLMGGHEHVSASVTLLLILPLVVATIAFFWKNLNFRNRWLNMFARLSFFIFFIHGYFMGAYRSVLVRLEKIAPLPPLIEDLAQALFVFATTVVLCLAAYVVLKLILRDRSRYVVAA